MVGISFLAPSFEPIQSTVHIHVRDEPRDARRLRALGDRIDLAPACVHSLQLVRAVEFQSAYNIYVQGKLDRTLQFLGPVRTVSSGLLYG